MMPPRIAVPSTAPSSYAVSDTALAAPAFAAGALERMSSFEMVSAAPMPMPRTTKARMSGATPCACVVKATMRYPATENTSAAGMSTCGGTRREIGTTVSPATIMAAIPGTSARPATIGESPSTSCRCCDTK